MPRERDGPTRSRTSHGTRRTLSSNHYRRAGRRRGTLLRVRHRRPAGQASLARGPARSNSAPDLQIDRWSSHSQPAGHDRRRSQILGFLEDENLRAAGRARHHAPSCARVASRPLRSSPRSESRKAFPPSLSRARPVISYHRVLVYANFVTLLVPCHNSTTRACQCQSSPHVPTGSGVR